MRAPFRPPKYRLVQKFSPQKPISWTRTKIAAKHFGNVIFDFSMSYGKEKAASSVEEAASCGIVPNYRTLLEDFAQFVEFVEWLHNCR